MFSQSSITLPSSDIVMTSQQSVHVSAQVALLRAHAHPNAEWRGAAQAALFHVHATAEHTNLHQSHCITT